VATADGILMAVPAWRLARRRLVERLDPCQLYRACYALLTVTALKLLWDGLRGYNFLRQPLIQLKGPASPS
jgi:hypothetical protein